MHHADDVVYFILVVIWLEGTVHFSSLDNNSCDCTSCCLGTSTVFLLFYFYMSALKFIRFPDNKYLGKFIFNYSSFVGSCGVRLMRFPRDSRFAGRNTSASLRGKRTKRLSSKIGDLVTESQILTFVKEPQA